MFRKVSTQKQQAFDFYNSFEWDKVTWPTFYQRVRLWGTETWEDKIKVKVKNQYRRRDSTPRGKWATEMTWYNAQPEPKASKSLFRNRLNGGYPKEEAILMWEGRMKVKESKKTAKTQEYKPYIPQRVVKKEPDENDFRIEVTYPSEVAKVFRKEYQKMIDEIEWELTYTSEKTEVAEMNSKLERLKDELDIFNSYNPKEGNKTTVLTFKM